MNRLTVWFAAILIAGVSLLQAQTVISDNPFAAGDANARLDVISTTKGALMPRLTTAQRDATMPNGSGTTAGMLIYNTTDGCYQYYDGTAWQCLTDTDTTVEPWYRRGTTVQATANTDNIYIMGTVGIKTATPDLTRALDVNGQTVIRGNTVVSPGQFWVRHSSAVPTIYIIDDGHTDAKRLELSAKRGQGVKINSVTSTAGTQEAMYFQMAGVTHLAIRPGGNTWVGSGAITTPQAFNVSGNAAKTVAGPWAALSDRRIKEDITAIASGLDRIMQLKPVSYKFNAAYRKAHNLTKNRDYYGYVAQEFQTVFPDDVEETQTSVGGADNLLLLDPTSVGPHLVIAVQELKARLDKIETTLGME